MAELFTYWINGVPVLFLNPSGQEAFIYWLNGVPILEPTFEMVQAQYQAQIPLVTVTGTASPSRSQYQAQTPRMTLGSFPVPSRSPYQTSVPRLTITLVERPSQARYQAQVPQITLTVLSAPSRASYQAQTPRAFLALPVTPAQAQYHAQVPRIPLTIMGTPSRAMYQAPSASVSIEQGSALSAYAYAQVSMALSVEFFEQTLHMLNFIESHCTMRLQQALTISCQHWLVQEFTLNPGVSNLTISPPGISQAMVMLAGSTQTVRLNIATNTGANSYASAGMQFKELYAMAGSSISGIQGWRFANSGTTQATVTLVLGQ